ncbi:MAG: zinc metalloprotease HtpX [Candidatus Zixiibacteriota bacterium]|nr:MAG: zinc metalloprotease HtpX [candidate division Zixibacteria bacterium]
MNNVKTAILFVILTLMLIFIGYLIGGRTGVTYAFIFALVMNFGSYWFSDKIVLKLYRARRVEEHDNPRLLSAVRSAVQMSGLPMPKVYVIPTESPNAFATGRNPQNAAVAVTEGILKILNDDELLGVISHELGHVRNRDILVGTIAATIAGAITYLAFMARWMPFFGSDDDEGGGNLIVMLIVGILAPIAAALVQMAISRQREYLADRTAAEISHKPLALAGALKKLHRASRQIPLKTNPASAHMFIVNPLTKRNFASLFSTHPPIEERIERLEKYYREGI